MLTHTVQTHIDTHTAHTHSACLFPSSTCTDVSVPLLPASEDCAAGRVPSRSGARTKVLCDHDSFRGHRGSVREPLPAEHPRIVLPRVLGPRPPRVRSHFPVGRAGGRKLVQALTSWGRLAVLFESPSEPQWQRPWRWHTLSCPSFSSHGPVAWLKVPLCMSPPEPLSSLRLRLRLSHTHTHTHPGVSVSTG